MSSLALLSLFSPSVSAATLVVADSTSLEHALAEAVDGDSIHLMAGRYAPVHITGARELTLRPEGNVAVSLAGLRVDSGARVRVEDVTVTGSAQAVTVQTAELTLSGVTLSHVGASAEGWAILARGTGTHLILDRVTLSDVQSTAGAIQLYGGAQATVSASSFSSCQGSALALYGGTAAVRGSTFADNVAIDGGAILADEGQLSLEGVTLSRNRADRGGAIFIGEDAVLYATEVVWSGGEAGTGGQLLVDGGTATLVRVGFIEGQADYGGSIALLSGSLSVRNAVWANSFAGAGGALFVDGGEASVSHAVFLENEAMMGAAVALESGALAVTRSILAGNTGAEALANSSTDEIRVEDALFWDNTSLWVGAVEASGVEEAEPRFTNTAEGDFTLRAGSPGLDATTGADLDGTPADLGIFGGPDAWPLEDADGDGFSYGRDCNDAVEIINEAAVDLWYDGIDSNCDGADDFDQDGDGHSHADCNDVDPDIHPENEDIKDGIDSNCDGFDLIDADEDGWPENLDCDDTDPLIAPDAQDPWYDGVDSNCSGGSDYDADNDGHDSVASGGDDCDDTNPIANPEVPEVSDDGIDQDCSGADLQTHTEAGDSSTEVAGEDASGQPAGGDSAAAAPHYEANPEDTIHGALTCASAARTAPGGAWAMLIGMAGVTVLRRRRSAPSVAAVAMPR